MNIAASAESKMQQAIDHLKSELSNIRTGRANPGLLEGVKVEVYGSQMRIKDLATVAVPESRQLLISPFDKNNCGNIAKAIEKANLGFSPIAEGNTVRIVVPQMDEKTRKEMTKLAKKYCEAGKVAVRNVRRDFNEQARKLKNEGEMAEDVMKRTEKDIQTLTDKFCSIVDELNSAKEKEILAK